MGAERLSLGCDIGGTEIKVVALEKRRIASRSRTPTLERDLIGSVVGAVREVLSSGVPDATLGVALPGFLDARRSGPIFVANLPALNGIPLRRILGKRLGVPVILEVDSNAGAYGESILGAGRGARRLLYVTLGTGVGAAMVVDGRIVRVSNHTVGHVAHLPLDPGGPLCSCGARGCVESVLGAKGIVWRASRAHRAGAELPPAALRSPQGLHEAAREGSRNARRILAEVGSLLGLALSMLANFLSPDRIVVGGGIVGAGGFIMSQAERALRGRVHPRLRETIRLVPSGLSPFSGAIGAALLGREGQAGDR